MKKIMHSALLGLLGIGVTACSGVNSLTDSGLPVGNVINVTESSAPNPAAPLQKYAASIRLLPYHDSRQGGHPHKIGISTQLVIGMSGTDLMVEPAVASIMTNSMRKHLDDAGFQLSSADALYELSGVVRELTYDVKARDEIYIVVESALKDRATGKMVWSGIVVEKNDRFAGVSGNSKKDIANYLRGKVGVVAAKTTESISSSLMASRPDLFNLTPGTQPVTGVTVLVAPASNISASAVERSKSDAIAAAGVMPAETPQASGKLLITSKLPRVKIYIDDVYFGLTPLRLELAAGVHNIRAELVSHKARTEKVSVRKGETTEIDIDLTR